MQLIVNGYDINLVWMCKIKL